MSTKEERRWRADRKILPIKVRVPQNYPGFPVVQIVDADVRERKPRRKGPHGT